MSGCGWDSIDVVGGEEEGRHLMEAITPHLTRDTSLDFVQHTWDYAAFRFVEAPSKEWLGHFRNAWHEQLRDWTLACTNPLFSYKEVAPDEVRGYVSFNVAHMLDAVHGPEGVSATAYIKPLAEACITRANELLRKHAERSRTLALSPSEVEAKQKDRDVRLARLATA